MAQLMVRNVDEAVVRELKKRAARRNHSAEQEHREILEQALLRPRRRSLAEVLAAMPDAGEDADFERSQIDRGRDEGRCTWSTQTSSATRESALARTLVFVSLSRCCDAGHPAVPLGRHDRRAAPGH